MSFNRRRNIFTLGDYQIQQHPHQYAKAQLSRKQNSDLFERDPFKIQSYNFHYAERPSSYPLQNLVNRVSSQTSAKRFETHFYNYDFAAARCDKENTAASSTATNNSNRFHEFRRRKFLHSHQQQQTPPAIYSTPYGGAGHTLNNSSIGSRQRLGNNDSNSSLRQQYQGQQQQLQYPQEQQLRQSSPHRHQQQHHAFCVPCSPNNDVNNLSAIYAYATPTASPQLRTRCNREVLQGIRAVPASSAPDAQHNLQHQQQQRQQSQQCEQQQQLRELNRSKSRSCLPVNQRFFSELGCRSSGTGLGGSGSNSTTALGSPAGKNQFNCARASLSQHNNINSNKRKPLQALSPKNLVTANVEQTKSSSGCRINININGLNAENFVGENVTIKIESEKRSVRDEFGLSKSSNNLSEHLASPNQADNFNIAPSKATALQNFGIDKRLSKFAISSLREVPSDRSQAEHERKLVALETKTTTADLKTIRSPPLPQQTEPTSAADVMSTTHTRRRSKERMPSLLPWNIDDTLRSCFTKENNPNIDLPHNRPTNLMRRIRTNYNSAFRDMQNLQKYADDMAEAKRRRTEKKLLNTCCTAYIPQHHRQQQKPRLQHVEVPSRILPDLTPPRRSSSRHSIHSNEFNITQNPMKCGSSELDRRQQSRQILNKSPLNVNINVYADKCKLLRV